MVQVAPVIYGLSSYPENVWSYTGLALVYWMGMLLWLIELLCGNNYPMCSTGEVIEGVCVRRPAGSGIGVVQSPLQLHASGAGAGRRTGQPLTGGGSHLVSEI